MTEWAVYCDITKRYEDIGAYEMDKTCCKGCGATITAYGQHP